jgi:CheY-like chemotaxis protein
MSKRASHSPTILLVEDNEDDEMMTVRAFSKQLPGGQVSVARDGLQAVRCVKEGLLIDGVAVSDRPDFILLDLKLPLVSGHQVLTEIRNCESTKNVPVVVFSSSDAPEDVSRSYAGGANTYIQKPIEFVAYNEALAEICRYWFSLATLPE